MSSEWSVTTIGEICTKVFSGGTPTSTNPAYYEGGTIPWLRTKEVNYCKIYDTEQRITQLGFENSSAKLVPVNSVIVAMYGNGDTAGRVAINKVPITTNQACCNLVIDESKADFRLVYYYLMGQYKALVDLKNGGAQQNLNGQLIKAFPIALPSIEEQCEIADFLEALDDRITLLRETNATLEAIAQALFKSWFVDFDPVRAKMEGRTPEGMDEATAALFPDGFETSELGEVPRGWRVMPFLDACDMQGGAQPPASQFIDTPLDGYVRLLQIRDFSSDAHKTYVPIEKKLKLATEDDVLIGRYGSASGDKAKDSLGRVCRGLAGAYNVALMKLVPVEVGREFALQLVDDPRFYQYLRGVSSKAVQSGFSKKELGQYKVVVPPAPLAKLYEQFGEAVWHRSKELRSQAETLSTLRDTLLPRLISGQLRVGEVPAVEHA